MGEALAGIYNSRNYIDLLALYADLTHLSIYNSRNYIDLLALLTNDNITQIYNSRNYIDLLASIFCKVNEIS